MRFQQRAQQAAKVSSVIAVMDVLLIVRVRVQRRKMPPLWISDRKVHLR
ncbi:MAG: hypothetical protein WA395_13555 [Nitrososphaeraceae archaeon]